ncbi:MAG: hypothetical protein ACK46G_08140 [Flavobacteriales bacterium]
MNRLQRITSTMAALGAAIVACLPIQKAWAQWSFTVDPTFQTQIVQQNVNDILLNEDGTLIASGRMRLPSDISDRRLIRLHGNGTNNPSFANTGVGGGKLTHWQDRFYVGHAQSLRRVLLNGATDPTFPSPNISPCRYFNSLQGGDYHVYPDGRVLICGMHQLHDSIRGYVGRHQLIWLTNEGCLDTTRTHRTGGNCAVYRFAELPNGQFICSGTCNEFDGQEVDWIFRVHADGSVDTTFRTGVYSGIVGGYLPLTDGRVYVTGNFRRNQAPLDTLRLVRFLSDGMLDPSFAIPQFSIGSIPDVFGSTVVSVQPWLDGNLLVTGFFTSVNGQQRGGICLLDTAGNVLPAFANSVLGPYTFGSITYASIESAVYDTANAKLYVCGAYSGYNDGLTNYPQQRFITRLNVQELSTGAAEQAPPRAGMQLWPNPSEGQLWISYTLPGNSGAVQLRIRDAQGRTAHTLQASGPEGQVVWDSRGTAPGVYTVELLREGRIEHTERLIIQP